MWPSAYRPSTWKPSTVIRRLLLLLLLAQVLPVRAEEGFGNNVSYPMEPFQVRMINWELTRGKKHLLVHFEVKNPTGEEHRCDWQQLIFLRRQDDSTMNSNYDALVDMGGGLTRTVGPFLMKKRSKVRVTVPFFLGQGDLPGRLELPDGRTSALIH